MISISEQRRKNEAAWSEAKKLWRLDVQRDGQRKTFTSPIPGRKGKLEAERKADLWLVTGGDSDIRFSELWEAFLESSKKLTGSGNYRNHESVGRLYLLPVLEKKKVKSITQNDMQNCINIAYAKGRSKKYLKNIRASLSALYTFARKCKVTMEPTDLIVIPRDAPVGERKILQPDELRILFDKDSYTKKGKEAPLHYIHAFRFLVVTGLRPGEVYGLQEADISDGVLRVRRSINIDGEITAGKNENARRWFVISEVGKQILADQKAMLKREGIISPWVFPDEYGDPVMQRRAYKQWMNYREEHGIESSLYELRHTMISIVSADLPEKLLKATVGHSESMDTGVYIHQVDGEALRAQQIIDASFKRIFEQSAENGAESGVKKNPTSQMAVGFDAGAGNRT